MSYEYYFLENAAAGYLFVLFYGYGQRWNAEVSFGNHPCHYLCMNVSVLLSVFLPYTPFVEGVHVCSGVGGTRNRVLTTSAGGSWGILYQPWREADRMKTVNHGMNPIHFFMVTV